ncbi:MAG: ATP-binding cassette domain-containing protein [Proteobacteria bacterium]|nr:ATP-binding cassette domain-containing protein [Pseudomonadota bacterium]
MESEQGPKSDQEILKVQGLKKKYSQRLALDDVTFSIKKGEFVILLGPNGAGKTTLFNLVTGLFNADSGLVTIGDNEIVKNPVKALSNLGVVFQQQTLDLELTVEQNLLFHADLWGMKQIEAKARILESTTRFGLGDRLKEKVRNLNSGHRRRIELIRAVLHQPPLVILDEPTAGLDISSRKFILERIKRMSLQDNVSVLWTTHLLEEVKIADRILVLHEGKLVFQGVEDEMLSNAGTISLNDAFNFYVPNSEVS